MTSSLDNRPIIHAVLFDLDGVLIDSMPHHIRAWQEEFAAWGVQVDPLIFRLREGEKAAATLAFAAQEYGLILTEAQAHQFVESKRHRYRKTAPKQLIDGAVDVLKTLRHRGIKTALVTGSIRRNLDHSISKDKQNLFDTIITADLCHQGKPDPEPYLRAVEALKMTPEHCLAVENAPLGIQSAKAAGVFTLALTSTLPTKYLKSADRIIDDLTDIFYHGAYILQCLPPFDNRGE